MTSTIKITMAAVIVLGAVGGTIWWQQEIGDSRSTQMAAGAPTSDDAAGTAAADQPARPRAEPSGVADASADAFAARLDALESNLTKLIEQQSSVTRQLDYLARNAMQDVAPTGSDDAATAELTPEEEAALVDAQVEAQAAVIEETVEAEPVDPRWAPEAVIALHEAFTSEVMAGLEVIAADCRTTLCRVELAIDPSVAGEDSLRRLAQVAPWSGYGFFQISGDPPEAIYYLSREGDTLPALDLE